MVKSRRFDSDAGTVLQAKRRTKSHLYDGGQLFIL